ncbi:MAG TPA: plastocyanin/azurin family copper-binding protein [Longimicrobium sp.]|nr:plastocyanin/azurin family copper-binding protein [Longimicrobium sp.]
MIDRKLPRIAAKTLAAAALVLALAPRAAHAQQPTVHTVRMLVEGGVPRFDPATVTIKPGDQVRFVNVSGGPHNVSFDAATLPQGMDHVMEHAMPDQIQPLWGKLLVDPNESYTISFAGARPGRYPVFCVPHMYDKHGGTETGMKGVIIVR